MSQSQETLETKYRHRAQRGRWISTYQLVQVLGVVPSVRQQQRSLNLTG